MYQLCSLVLTTIKVALRLGFFHDQDCVRGNLIYDSTKVSSNKAQDVISSFSSAILDIIDHHYTGIRISDLKLYSQTQVQTFLQRMHATPVTIEGCVHFYIFEHASTHLDSLAVFAHDANFS